MRRCVLRFGTIDRRARTECSMRRWLGHRRSSGSNARGPTFPWPLSPTVPALFFPWLSCAVVREVPVLGRSVCRVAIVVRSVKLVHQCIESGEAGMSSWRMFPILDRRQSCSARFCRSVDPPVRSTCPLPGAGSITRWFTWRQPFSWR